MKTIIPIASGKGGVGKSFLTANLGIAIAQEGKTVVLIDLDLGASNLHTLLGIRNRNPGIGHFVHGHNRSIEELLVQTGQNGLFFIPGDALYSGTANLPFFRKTALLRQIEKLPADFVLLDLGAGSAFNTLDFFLSAPAGLIVTVPETTAILNAYSFLKAAMLRLLHRSFPPKSMERIAVQDFVQKRLEGAELSLADAIRAISNLNPESGRIARERLDQLKPRVIVNMGRTASDIRIGSHLRTVVRKNLDTDLEFLSYLPYDPVAQRAALERIPTVLAHPNTPYAAAIRSAAQKIILEPVPQMPRLFSDNEDIEDLAQEFTGSV